MPPKKVYTKKDPIDHILLRSSMYVGSKSLITYEDFVSKFDEDTEEYKIFKKYVNSSPAILRIFIEVLSNAVDNVDRSRKAKIPCTAIKVNIDKETGETTIWNDGDIIPIEMHPEENMYNHSLIFGHLLTGSNYDDTEEREISGLNGLGGKLTNVFASKFVVKGLDPNNKKTFEQTWINNMRSPEKPIVKSSTLKKGYTEIKYFPDFKQFGIDGYTEDIIGLYLKYVIDAAMLTKVKVYFNNDLINVNNLLSYSKLYSTEEERLSIKFENVEVVLAPSTEFQHIAFTNGIYNRLGGQHVDSVCESLFRPLVEKFTKKGKPTLNIKDIKQFFKVFVNCIVINPEFDSQNKCIDPETKILMWDGTIKKAKDIKINDIVISDDGLPSTVKNICSGKDNMYSIYQRKGITYKVNSKHTLSLKCPSHKNLKWHQKSRTWVFGWFDTEIMNYRIKRFKAYDDKETQLSNAKKFALTIDDNNIFDIDIKTYINLNSKSKEVLYGFKPENINWDEKFVSIDPYILGMWLGDGHQKGTVFSSIDEELINKWKEWGYKNDIEITKYSKYNYGIISHHGKKFKVNHKYLTNPFKDELLKYNLIDEKHIPKEYLLNSREVRFNLLAGIVDTDGCIIDKGTGLIISQGLNHTRLINDVIYLVKSLGFSCIHTIINTTWPEYKTGNRKNGKAHKLRICGNLDEIPVLLERKKGRKPSRNVLTSNIEKIEKNGIGTYIGFELDRKSRFLLEDFTVTHNCKLESPKIKFEVKQNDIKKILKWSVIDDIEDMLKAKEMVVLKKSEKKKKGYVKIDGYDQANNAGGKNSHECGLILCEGLSAKTYAVAGIDKGVYGKSGRDWWGILPLRGKCLSPDTKIITWDGEIKKAKDIKIGDFLINEEGEKTEVLKLYSGEDTMYEIQQNKGINYTVNSMHTLSLKLSGNNNITWSDNDNAWNMIYYDTYENKVITKVIYCKVDHEVEQEKCIESGCIYYDKVFCSRSSLTRHYKRLHKEINCPPPKKSTVVSYAKFSKDEGYIKMTEFRDKIKSPNIIDIDIEDYLQTDDHTKHLLKGFKLETHVNWEHKDVYIDPYILGMWLGDGFSNGYGFASEDVELINEWYKWCNNNNCEIVHNNRDSFTIRKKNSMKQGGEDKRIPIGTSDTSNKNCRACSIKLNYACSNDKELDTYNKKRIIQILEYNHTERKYGLNPLKEVLDKYNLINNKHIPNDYIFNNKETRLKILAGFIDTDGYVGDDGRIEIVQSIEHKNLIDSIQIIAKSLGFYCYISNKTPNYSYKGYKKYSKAIRLSISGNGIHEIPTILLRKQLNHIFSRNALHNKFKVVNKGIGPYVGFMTDKTHRFLLEDFTVTHNCLNVRNSSPTIIAKNAVITDLIQAIGLKIDTDYTDDKNFKTLNYGKVVLLTDADNDGIHISGLLMNFFHYLYPSLLEREEHYIVSMATPIVRVFNPKGDILFYDENKFKEFQKTQTKSFKSKYYKGLGTTKPEDVPDTFGAKMIEYVTDDNVNTAMDKVFHKKFADIRKDWLENYDQSLSMSLDDNGSVVNMEIANFLNTEVIKFSHDDCKRSIPSLFDGLKQSQRKVLYAVKKRKLTFSKQSLKVAQLGGYVAEHTNYHHGEQNLYDTIIKLAQEYPGTNNIPLLYRDGQFGTRLSGKDAASPRYIFTKMESLTPLLFREEDDVLLEYVVDDGDVVEPTFYIPILPMILINGALGIGTGWSSSIPCFNPLDIIECVKSWLENDGDIITEDPDTNTTFCTLPELTPWYRGFTGKIEFVKDKFVSYGLIDKDKDKVYVSELPIGLWTDKFKENCEDWLVDKKIKNFKNNSSYNKVNFTITESDDGFNCNIENIKLYSYLHVTNMVLFNEKEQIKKYTIEGIVDDFCKMRYSFYTKRKNHIISSLEKDLMFAENKARFIQEIMDTKLNIMNVEEDKVVIELEKRKYDKDFKNSQSQDDDDTSGSGNKHGYEYLLRLQVRTFTANKVKQLKDDITSINGKLRKVKSTTEKEMWMSDIEEFEKEYTKWLKTMETQKPKKTSKK